MCDFAGKQGEKTSCNVFFKSRIIFSRLIKFWDDLSADCYDAKIIFSPLRRARDTCFSIVPSHLHRICNEKEFLRETLPWEHIIPFGVINRIKLFETWLLSVDAKKIVIVGHSQYFKR